MIRLILIALFLVFYFLIGILFCGILWIIGKIDPKKKMKASLTIVQIGFRIILCIAGVKVTVIGKERIPRDTSVLYVGNHRSYFDVLLVYSRVPDLTGFVAKKEMEKIPFLSTWMKLVNCLFLDRSDLKQGLQTILTGIEKLKNGISICIFPEGTRNRGEELSMLEFHEGSFKMAEKSGCPVVPIGLNNTAAIWENHFPWIRRAHVVMEFGEPIYPKTLERNQKKFLGLYTKERISEIINKNATQLIQKM